MSRLSVKICGTTSLDDARLATDAGADLLGFIFYPPSPRYVTPDTVTEIVSALRDEMGGDAPRMVGIFVDEPPDRIETIMATAGLDLAQLHGSEPPVELRRLLPRAFKAIRPRTRGDAEAMVATYAADLPGAGDVPDFLLDSYDPWIPGGTGIPASLAIAQVIARRFRLLLAGGLTPESVATAIREVRPWGVDVVSGVEAEKGRKDPARLRAFIRNARAAAQSLDAQGD